MQNVGTGIEWSSQRSSLEGASWLLLPRWEWRVKEMLGPSSQGALGKLPGKTYSIHLLFSHLLVSICSQPRLRAPTKPELSKVFQYNRHF